MPLLEALLLDPYRMDVWIANRTDGVSGTGTQNDPFDGSTQAKFDALMSGIVNYTCVHLGPGTFQTNGYSDAGGGWQLKPGMKIVGSGMDATTLKLAGGSTNNAHFYAMGHAIASGNQPNACDFFEVSDLTLDCNLAAFTGTSVASGAVRVLGNHSKVRRLKVINWGTKSAARPCFVVSTITATDLIWVEDCGIEDCIAVSPSTSNPTGAVITVFHAGAIETVQSVLPQGYGVAPYIRNCFADSGLSFPFTIEIHGLSLGWCKAGILEGNQIHNVTYGVFQQPSNAQDVVIRNNWFKNVYKGVLLGAIDGISRSGSLSVTGTAATVSISSGSNIYAGDIVLLTTSPGDPFNNVVFAVTGASGNTFTFSTSLSAHYLGSVSIQRLFGVGNSSGQGLFPGPGGLTIEGNVIEVVTGTPQPPSGNVIGLHLNDLTTTQDPAYPAYLFARVVIRDNKIRYLDGVPNASFVGYGMQLNSAMDMLVRNNVVETIPTAPPQPIQNDRCGAVAYFNNLQPIGRLIQGVNADTGNPYEELATVAEFALVVGLFNRRT